MKICARCNKILHDGDEAHVVDNEAYCSADCAVLSITDEIIMNAKEMAKEQYTSVVTVTLVKDTPDSATCATCGKNLAECDTMFAAEGLLFCSHDCGVKHVSKDHANAQEYFYAVSEEITPEDAGLKKPESDYMKYDQIFEAIESLAKSHGRYTRLYHNMCEDSEYRSAVLQDLEEQHFKDVVDLILYLES